MNRYVVHENHRTTYECGQCSAVVTNMQAHDRWHQRVVAMAYRAELSP